jgi:hypothetical protein
MAIETTMPRTRRALLAAGLAAGAASIASALGRGSSAEAANGGSILLGTAPFSGNGIGPNQATSSTGIYTTAGDGLVATTDDSSASGVGASPEIGRAHV